VAASARKGESRRRHAGPGAEGGGGDGRPQREENPMKTFITLDVALDINRQLPELARQIALRDRSLEDQLTRAAHSVALNLGEGNRKSGKDRLNKFRIASGSAAEVEVALKLAIAWGYVDGVTVAPLMAQVDRLLRLCWGLVRPR
jgi:four helix bundle protein